MAGRRQRIAQGYRELLLLQRPLETQDANNDPVVSWITEGSMRAQVTPARGREFYSNDEIRKSFDSVVRMRRTPLSLRVTAKWRFLHGSVVYNIQSAPPAHAVGQRELEFTVTNGLNQG